MFMGLVSLLFSWLDGSFIDESVGPVRNAGPYTYPYSPRTETSPAYTFFTVLSSVSTSRSPS